MSGTHAKYSPSKLSRIIGCPASPSREAGLPNPSSVYAEEGTMLHEVMEFAVRLDAKAGKGKATIDKSLIEDAFELAKVDEPTWPDKLTKEQIRACEDAFDYVEGVKKKLRLQQLTELRLEVKTSLAYLGLEDVAGTADVRMRTPLELHVFDYKFGQGVYVDVLDNPQFLAYALGSFKSKAEFSTVKKVVIHCVQPRLNNMYSVEYTTDELIQWFTEVLEPAITEADSENPSCFPGDTQCKWCLAKNDCNERHENAAKIAEEIFMTYADAEKAGTKVSDEKVLELFKKLPSLEIYIKDLRARAYARCCSGEGFPGHKLVAGRGSRKWKNEAKALEFLESKVDDGDIELDELFVSKFVTPPQAEKLTKAMKKDPEFKELYEMFPGKPTMVSEDDPRKEMKMSATSAFADYAK